MTRWTRNNSINESPMMNINKFGVTLSGQTIRYLTTPPSLCCLNAVTLWIFEGLAFYSKFGDSDHGVDIGSDPTSIGNFMSFSFRESSLRHFLRIVGTFMSRWTTKWSPMQCHLEGWNLHIREPCSILPLPWARSLNAWVEDCVDHLGKGDYCELI